jgi:UDP-N-acetylglucosamine 2-epimerase (non-hydrolysing)
MIDSLVALRPRIAEAGTAASLGLARYVVATFHRPANVDDPACLATIVAQICALARSYPVVFPMHPRTAARLADAGQLEGLRASPDVHVVEPLGYIAFLSLVSGAAAVVTDSGGIQEETSYLGIPCLTVRSTTERPVTIQLGTNRLIRPDAIAEATLAMAAPEERVATQIPLWDGATAARAVASLKRFLARDLLALAEPA